MGFHEVETFLFQIIPINRWQTKHQLPPLTCCSNENRLISSFMGSLRTHYIIIQNKKIVQITENLKLKLPALYDVAELIPIVPIGLSMHTSSGSALNI